MESPNKHPLHLKNPDLQTSEEVKRAVSKKEDKGEKVKVDPSDRIEAYMDRLENVFLNKDENTRKRNLELFKDKIYDALIIKKENFPESYFELQKKVARERGEQITEIPENVRKQMIEVSINDQKASLDSWMDYLTSDDAVYPTWFKYYVWKNITKLSQFDKERGEFKKRTDTTVAPFPDIYREPLAQIADIYEKVKEDNKNLKDEEIKEAFTKKFPSLYAELIQKSLILGMENRESIEGEWVKYNHGNKEDGIKLFNSLENKGTGWCTAGKSTAETQVSQGDFYVYYSKDNNGEPNIPRLAIRMNGQNKIGEVRGVLPQQNVEPIMQETLDTKLQEFGTEANIYKKKSSDMKTLTLIDEKVQKQEALTKEELKFLYQLDSKIEGFGYQADPRISEILNTRNKIEDAKIIFNNKIVTNVEEIREDTKVYIGNMPQEKDTFKKLQNVEYIYTNFPDKRVEIFEPKKMEYPNTPKEWINLFKERNVYMEDGTDKMLEKMQTSKLLEGQKFIKLTVEDLFGDTQNHTYEQICNKAQELGLELCEQDDGPKLRLSAEQNPGDWYRTAMKSIETDGDLRVWYVNRYDDGPEDLYWRYGYADYECSSDDRFVFRLSK